MEWDDITQPPRRLDRARVTMAWRIPQKGSPVTEVTINIALLTLLGWKPSETRVRIFVSRDRSALRLDAAEDGKLLCAHGGTGSIAHALPWVESERRGAETIAFEADATAGRLVLHLPDWACGKDEPAAVAVRLEGGAAIPASPPAAALAALHDKRMGRTPHAPRTVATISARDQEAELRREVKELLASGMRGRAIADETGIPISEVLAHIAAIEAAQRAGLSAG